MTPEDGVICGHHVLGYDQWYTRLIDVVEPDIVPTRPACRGDVYAAVGQCRATYVIHNYILSYQKSPDTRTGKGPPPPCIWTFLPVWCFFLCTYSTFKTHSTIPTFVMVFAGKLFISLVSEVLWSVAI